MLIEHSISLTVVLILLLVLTTIEDIRSHRIRNLWILCSIIIAVIGFMLIGGWSLASSSLLGMLTGGLLLLPFYLAGGMAAGDIKLMAAVGAFLGTKTVFMAVLATLIAGSVIGLFVLALNGGMLAFLHRYFMSIKLLLLTGSPSISYLPPASSEPAAIRFPYALAISVGTLAIVLYTQPATLLFR